MGLQRIIMMHILAEQIDRVVTWAKDKGIYGGELTALDQLLGAKEEALEFRKAFIKDEPIENKKKELGDIVVFLVNYTYLIEGESGYLGIKQLKEVLSKKYECKGEDNSIGSLSALINSFISENFLPELYLPAFAQFAQFDLAECVALAMDKNEKRKHTMKEGKLIKQEDLEPPCLSYRYKTFLEGKSKELFLAATSYRPFEAGISPSDYKSMRLGTMEQIVFKDGSRVDINHLGDKVEFII